MFDEISGLINTNIVNNVKNISSATPTLKKSSGLSRHLQLVKKRRLK